MQELISVIIPVYNVEKYLKECLDSITDQTYKNIEIVIIDDGSKDNSGIICDEYARRDNRIKIIHKENEGVSIARNIGIGCARGKYITFIDSDDFVENNYIEMLYKHCKESNADLSICGVIDVREGNKIRESKKVNKIIDGKEALKELLDEKYFSCVIWAKMFKTNIIKNYEFNPETKIAEDLEMLYKLLPTLDRVVIDTKNKLYFFRERENSAISDTFNINHLTEIDISNNIVNYVSKNFPEIEKYAIKRYIRVNMSYILKLLKQDEIDDVILNSLRANIIKYKKEAYYRFSIKRKILLFNIIHNLKLLKYLIGGK